MIPKGYKFIYYNIYILVGNLTVRFKYDCFHSIPRNSYP